MSAHPTPTIPGTDPGQPAADAQYYRRVLHELIDLGADLARQLHRQATASAALAPPANHPHADPASDAAVDRIARCVRRTILLAQKIAEPARPGAARDPGPSRAPRCDTPTTVIPCRKDPAPTGAGSDPPAQRDDRPILLPYANRLRNP